MSDARAELRNLIEPAIREAVNRWLVGVSDFHVRAFANAAVGVFDLVEVQRTDRGHCYVARTKEETP